MNNLVVVLSISQGVLVYLLLHLTERLNKIVRRVDNLETKIRSERDNEAQLRGSFS